MKHLSTKKFQKGQLLVELILVIGLVGLLLPAMLMAFYTSREGKVQQEQRMTATQLLKEAEVALKSIKNNNWDTIRTATAGVPYHPSVSGTSWILSSDSETVNGFTRSVVINDVLRDTSGAIVTSGGTADPSTKQIVITISWPQPFASSVTSTFYLTRTSNMTYSETTQSIFTSGTETGTSVVATNGSGIADDGEIQLSTGGGHGNWCDPELNATTLDLPKNGVATGMSATLGNGYVGTGENASGVSFAKVNISSADPPVPSMGSTFDGYKTNGVFGDSNYAYIATDNNGKELVIIDLNQVINGKYQEVGYFNTPNNNDAISVFVSGNVGYVTAASTLYTVDLSSKTGQRAMLDSVTLPGTGNKVIVQGNYAYVAIGTSSTELQLVNVSNPSNITLDGRGEVDPSNINSGDVARDIYINESATRAYVVIEAASNLREFYIFNITNKSANFPIVGSYEANGMSPKGVALVPGNLAIIVGSGGEEYQVVNIANEANPARCGGLTVGTSINGIQSVMDAQNNAYSYIILNADPEFRIIQGGSGSTFATSGTFESASYDAGYSVSYNRFSANVNQPSQTTLRMQVAVADQVSGSCPSLSSAYTFVGPNGNASAYFTPSGNTISGVIPFGSYSPSYVNPAQCFRYKAWFDTTDVSQTPVLYDMTINRSP